VNVRFGQTCAVAYKITNGLVAKSVTLASDAGDRPDVADDGHCDIFTGLIERNLPE
jgi:hypothetical protein